LFPIRPLEAKKGIKKKNPFLVFHFYSSPFYQVELAGRPGLAELERGIDLREYLRETALGYKF